jgi:hypothetical protein
MRSVIDLLSKRGYPIKSIDVEHAPDLAEKYDIQAVPTFVVIDSSGKELDRTQGSQPAGQLARFYLSAKTKAQPPSSSRAHVEGDEDSEEQNKSDAANLNGAGAQSEADNDTRAKREAESSDEPVFTNPKPWETVVRIRVLAQGSVGFGSGTIIHSTPEESLILTCAHIFKVDGHRQPPPNRFNRKIMIDLFDGKLHGERPAQVHFVESVEGKAIDYDFSYDVGLIQIRPGRRLAAARVVPAHWDPRSRMKMLTVGCSEGQDATAWHTVILDPQMRGLSGNPNYQAIECMIAPKQGRSGGGLFTTDGYLAGVCNFAEPRGNHGLYATPRSIYKVLDRNNMMALYAPVTSGSASLVADRGARPSRRGGSPITVARGQSPDREERQADQARTRPGDVTIPDPEILGIKPPLTVATAPAATAPPTRRTAWHPTHNGTEPAKLGPLEPLGNTKETDLSIDPAADHDRFSHFQDEHQAPEGKINSEDIPSPVAATPLKSRWRPARSAEVNASTEAAGR